MNLILNARDAMLPRAVILTIEARGTADAIQIELSDTGCGIKPDDLKKIFHRSHEQGRRKVSSQHSGSGRGLLFVKNIIDDHRVCVSVESEPAEGTTF